MKKILLLLSLSILFIACKNDPKTETEEWIPYELPSHLVGKLWKGRYRGQEQKWFLLRFHGSDELINIDTEIPEFEEWQWMDKADLVPNIVPFKRDTYMRVLEAFKEHLVCKT